jgi:hypothetical protein
MTNCSETRDTKTAMREPVKHRITLIVLKLVEFSSSAEVILCNIMYVATVA